MEPCDSGIFVQMRGLGPYVINDITSRGAIRLETLDGEPMTNFINGSCLKRFHEPLTDEMLEKMHAAKTRKQALETMKTEAQEEAKIRAAKAKAKRHQVSAVAFNNRDMKEYIEPLLLEVGIDSSKNHICAALLDSGASVNIMAEFFFHRFVNHPLSATELQLNTVANQPINCKGTTTVTLHVDGYKMDCLFYVTSNEHSAHDLILGRAWMHRHNNQFD